MIVVMLLMLWGATPPVKQEVEIRIGRHEVPAAILAWMDPALRQSSRVRYFRQTDGEERSYEIKFASGPHHWSVEFHTDGTFKEAERLIDASLLPASITAHLDSRFTSWRITRAQAQHEPVGDWHRHPPAPIGYEIEVDGAHGREVGRFELTFTSDGGLLAERRLIEIPMDI